MLSLGTREGATRRTQVPVPTPHHTKRHGIAESTCQTGTLLKAKSKCKGSPYSIAKRRVPELIPVFSSQPAVINPAVGCHYFPPGPVTPATLTRAATSFTAW